MDMSLILNSESKPIPITLINSKRSYTAKVIEDVRDINEHHYNFSSLISPTHYLGGVKALFVGDLANLTLKERATLSRWKFTLLNSTDANAKLIIRPLVKTLPTGLPTGEGNFMPNVRLFESGTTWLGSNATADKYKYISSLEGGTGSSNIETIAELDGLHQDLCLTVKFATAPTTGSIIIVAEAQG